MVYHWRLNISLADLGISSRSYKPHTFHSLLLSRNVDFYLESMEGITVKKIPNMRFQSTHWLGTPHMCLVVQERHTNTHCMNS